MEKVFRPVAIVGYGCVFPANGYNPDAFWKSVISGSNGIADVSKKYWKESLYYTDDKAVEDKTYCKKGGVVEDFVIPEDTAIYYGLDIDKVSSLNKTQKMTLDTILQAMDYARYKVSDLEKAGFYIGNMLGDSDVPDNMLVNRIDEVKRYIESSIEFKNLPEEQKNKIENEFTKKIKNKFSQKNNDNLIASSLLFNLKKVLGNEGNGCIVDGACSGSGVVIDEAVKSIQYGQNDICIASAVLGNMVVTGNIGFAKIGGLSETSAFPMDDKADGLIPGEGAGTIILKDLKKAIKDGDKIYAVIRGTGVASDGKGQSIYAPSSKGQLLAMNRSIEVSGLEVSNIDYVETHATGTKVGDKIEIETIRQFFEKDYTNRKIPIGSVKSQIGHAFSAAGMANIIKIIEAIHHGIIPPTHNFERVPEGVKLDNLYINTKEKEWVKRGMNIPRRAMINAFGFGGINANVLMEEYVPEYHKNLVIEENKYLKDEYAIVGIGCMNSDVSNYEEYRADKGNNNEHKIVSINGRYPEVAKSLYSNKKGYFIDDFKFPFIKFHIPPKILKELDKSQQYSLVTAGEAIEDYGREKIDGLKTGVYVGTMMGLGTALDSDFRARHVEYIDAITDIFNENGYDNNQLRGIKETVTSQIRSYLPKIEEDTLPGYMDNIIAGRISNFYDFAGKNAVYDKDIVSFEAALYQAMLSLKSGENETVVVGAVNGNSLPEIFDVLDYINDDLLRKYNMNLKDSKPAEGAVFFVIKKICDVTENDHIYAKISDMDYLEHCRGDNLETTERFYYGAQDAFRLLDKILEVEGETSQKVINIQTSNIGGQGFSYFVGGQAATFESKQDISSISYSYYASDSRDELFKCDVKEEEFSNCNKRFKVVITHNSEYEKNRKIGLAKKCMAGGVNK